MREIKFRGQVRRLGEKVNLKGEPVPSKWVYGGIFQGQGERSVIYDAESGKYTVYSDTVGQYTGLKDCTGTEIYEGDLVKDFISDKTYQVIWDDYGLFIFTEIGSTSGGFDYYEFEDEAFKDCVAIIGNIHDNPELLAEVK